MFQIKKSLKALTLVFAITFILVNIFGTNISQINHNINSLTVYASPKGGFRSGSFKSSGGFTKSYKSGSFSNTKKKSIDYSAGSQKNTSSNPTYKRSFIPIPIFWSTHTYGPGYYGSSALWGISIFFKIIIFIALVFLIIKFIKRFRR